MILPRTQDPTAERGIIYTDPVWVFQSGLHELKIVSEQSFQLRPIFPNAPKKLREGLLKFSDGLIMPVGELFFLHKLSESLYWI